MSVSLYHCVLGTFGRDTFTQQWYVSELNNKSALGTFVYLANY